MSLALLSFSAFPSPAFLHELKQHEFLIRPTCRASDYPAMTPNKVLLFSSLRPSGLTTESGQYSSLPTLWQGLSLSSQLSKNSACTRLKLSLNSRRSSFSVSQVPGVPLLLLTTYLSSFLLPSCLFYSMRHHTLQICWLRQKERTLHIILADDVGVQMPQHACRGQRALWSQFSFLPCEFRDWTQARLGNKHLFLLSHKVIRPTMCRNYILAVTPTWKIEALHGLIFVQKYVVLEFI